MELDLIDNLFLFNATESRIGFVENYKTSNFGTKRIYNLGYLWDALSYRGYLYDVVKHDEYGQLWEDFGWIYDKNDGRFTFQPSKRYIVDFDLDCFTAKVLDKRIAIPEDILFEKFTKHHNPQYHHYYTYADFVNVLIANSVLTTLCFENGFCGGYKQAFKIFERIDELFFDNQLGQ